MEIRQKKLSNVHTFKFGDEKFNFAFRDRSGSGDADIAYADLPFKTSVRIDDNTWWRNAGYIWCVVGGLSLLHAVLTDSSIAGRGFWLLVGLACLAVYRATRVAYTVLQARNGNVFIIQDRRTHDSILGELMKRRKEQLLLLYGTVDGDSTLENEVAKFKYLQEQQVLSSAEAAARIAQAEGIFGAPVPAARRVLN